MLWTYLKRNFRPQLTGIPSTSSSSILSKDLINTLDRFAQTLGCSFIRATKPRAFLLDGLICDTAPISKPGFPFPTGCYWGIEWQWDPQKTKWDDFIYHDLIKIFHFNSDNKMAIYLQDNKGNPNARNDILNSIRVCFPHKRTFANLDIIEIERIGTQQSYTLNMHRLCFFNNQINRIDSQQIFP